MAHPCTFRFGTGAYQAQSRAEYLVLIYEIGAHGYQILLQPDHFGADLVPLSPLMAAAKAESQLRIGTTIFANDLHHPVVLAHEGATLDVLIEGCFECGIGAGYEEAEYRAAGISFEPAAMHTVYTHEAITLFTQLWLDAPATFNGTC
jgi:alkanesulfonate monooxygenase SsuD/methylene tetrahydromethanopterin reductase-like flavin-dependent oxidoreductase (luciferase family)